MTIYAFIFQYGTNLIEGNEKEEIRNMSFTFQYGTNLMYIVSVLTIKKNNLHSNMVLI